MVYRAHVIVIHIILLLGRSMGELNTKELIQMHSRFLTGEQMDRFHRHLQGGRGQGNGEGSRGGGQGGRDGNPLQQDGMGMGKTINFLFDHVNVIQRTVVNLTLGDAVVGTEANTTSTDPQVVEAIQRHVYEMHQAVMGRTRVRDWDPAFIAVSDNVPRLYSELVNLTDGMRAKHAGSTRCSAQAIVSHAYIVSNFVNNGWSERPKEHAAPQVCREPEGDDENGFHGNFGELEIATESSVTSGQAYPNMEDNNIFTDEENKSDKLELQDSSMNEDNSVPSIAKTNDEMTMDAIEQGSTANIFHQVSLMIQLSLATSILLFM